MCIRDRRAFASGMTTACVSRLERVNGNPTVQTLDQIADGLKLQTMRLFDEDLISPENRRLTALQRSFFAAQELPAERQEELSLLIQNYIRYIITTIRWRRNTPSASRVSAV